MIAPNIPKILISSAVFVCIFLFFRFIIIVIKDVGIKNIKLIPCDRC